MGIYLELRYIYQKVLIAFQYIIFPSYSVTEFSNVSREYNMAAQNEDCLFIAFLAVEVYPSKFWSMNYKRQ